MSITPLFPHKLLLPIISLLILNAEARAAKITPQGVKIAITRVRPVKIDAAGQSVHPLQQDNGWFQHGVQFVISAKNLPPGARAISSGLRLNLMSRFRRFKGKWRDVANTQLNRTSFVTHPFWTGGAMQLPQHGLFTPYVKVRLADGQEKTYWGHPGKGKSNNFWVGETTYRHALENLRALDQGKTPKAVPTASGKVNAEYRQYFNAGTTTESTGALEL